MFLRKNAALFIAITITILVITGIIYGYKNPINISNYIASLEDNNNLILQHILVILLFFISTLSIIGIILQTIYIGIESISIGYIISNFIIKYNIKGLIYSLITISINKGIYIIILSYLFTTSIVYIKRIINNQSGKNKDSINDLLIPLLKKYLIIIIFLLLYDVLIYLFGNKFLNYLTFML